MVAGAVPERTNADGSAETAGGVAKKCLSTVGRVVAAFGVLKRANAPLAVLPLPVVLLKSAPAPVAVFRSAVFASRVPAPTPVQKVQ